MRRRRKRFPGRGKRSRSKVDRVGANSSSKREKEEGNQRKETTRSHQTSAGLRSNDRLHSSNQKRGSTRDFGGLSLGAEILTVGCGQVRGRELERCLAPTPPGGDGVKRKKKKKKGVSTRQPLETVVLLFCSPTSWTGKTGFKCAKIKTINR